MSDQYRDNVAFVVQDDTGRLLVGERADIPGQWQLPQGGVDTGETIEEALWRELNEETGLTPDDVTIAGRSETVHYRYPPEVAEKREHDGQRQTYFLLRLRPGASTPLPGEEFTSFRWDTPREALGNIVDFKKKAYTIAFEQLCGDHL